MTSAITAFFMFEGRAEEAMNFYLSLFEGSSLTVIERYGTGEQGAQGSVKRAKFILNGQSFMCVDSPVKHGFTFTPAMSLFVDCQSASEVDRLFGHLSAEGQVLMPLGNYGFSERFGWLNDRFGVSWQLNFGG